jgi:hypothetical protein
VDAGHDLLYFRLTPIVKRRKVHNANGGKRIGGERHSRIRA